MRKPRVLIVDDNRTNHLAMSAVLEDGHELLFADSGQAAIAMVEQRADIDVVLMDVHMPELDGFETAKRIKQLRDRAGLPIIFVTAVYRDDPFVKRGYEAGGIDYFSKPFDPEILKMKIAAYSSFRMQADLLRERELHIRESEELLRVGRRLSSMLESLPVGVLIADVEGRICQTTDQAARILGADASVSDAYGAMLGWWDSAGHMIRSEAGPLARALRAGETTHSEPLLVRCVDGTTKTILASSSPLHGAGGQRVGAVVLIRDLTESRKIEEDMAARVARLIGLGVELEETTGR